MPEETKPAPKKRGRPRKTAEDKKKTPVKRVAKKAEPKVSKDQYTFAVGRRKKAVARIFMYKSGKGEIEVNGKPLNKYFGTDILQEIAGQALQESTFKKSARIVAKVRGGGPHGQAGAVRLGIARVLLKLDETLRPTFRVKGYLTRDPRRKERKKPGLKKARRAPQFSKR